MPPKRNRRHPRHHPRRASPPCLGAPAGRELLPRRLCHASVEAYNSNNLEGSIYAFHPLQEEVPRALRQSQLLDPKAVEQLSQETLRAHGSSTDRGFVLSPASFEAACSYFKAAVLRLYSQQGWRLAGVEAPPVQQGQPHAPVVEFKAIEPRLSAEPLTVRFLEDDDAAGDSEGQQSPAAAEKGKTRLQTLQRFLGLEPRTPFRWNDSRWSALLRSGLFEEASAVAVLQGDGTAQVRLRLREARQTFLSPGVSFDSALKGCTGELTYQDLNWGGRAWALRGALRRTLGASKTASRLGGPPQSVASTEVSLSNETLRKAAGLWVARLVLSDVSTTHQGPPKDSLNSQQASLGGAARIVGRRRSGATCRLEFPLVGAPEGAPPLGAPEPGQLAIGGLLELEAHRQIALFAQEKRPEASEETEASADAATSTGVSGWAATLQRRVRSVWRQASPLTDPQELSLSEAAANPQLAEAPAGHDTAKASLSISLLQRKEAHPSFLGPPFEVSVQLSGRLGASAPLTVAGLCETSAEAKKTLWGPPADAQAALSDAAAAARETGAGGRGAAIAAAPEAARSVASDRLWGVKESGMLPHSRGLPQWAQGATLRMGAFFRSTGEFLTEKLTARVPFVAAALLQQLQRQRKGQATSPQSQPFVRLDAKGALSVTPYAFLSRPEGKVASGRLHRGVLQRLLRLVDLRGLCLQSVWGAHLFVGSRMLKLLPQGADALLPRAAAAAAAEGPPGEVPTLESEGAPRGLERSPGAAAILQEPHSLILSAEHSLLLPFVIRRQLLPGQVQTSVPLFELVAFVDGVMMPLSLYSGGEKAAAGSLDARNSEGREAPLRIARLSGLHRPSSVAAGVCMAFLTSPFPNLPAWATPCCYPF
ncbi:hypothetical protein cyc_03214 [Cyclospora cayetanensis]|uniref:Uncharacterized protein n=1 Tax=Cyclospora cayetanensis TaxID=88456 RepID=A0A1D3D7D1_9EIME|nr:hypothetical protein cyc_03214 [Cyclospora cayetanensis]